MKRLSADDVIGGVAVAGVLIPLGIAIAAPLVAVRVWAAWVCYGWFLADPFGMPRIGYAEAVGVVFALGAAQSALNADFGPRRPLKREDDDPGVTWVYGAHLAAPACYVGLAWLLRWWIYGA
jgi:mannose/fructose/N-acetylgalactosamine-specific phosphotransferase system component IIC